MYIRSLSIRRLKRIREFNLTFPAPRRGARGRTHVPWTVLIGENGMCKTAILQAIALTAAGSRQVNTLAAPVVGHLCDRRVNERFEAEAVYSFSQQSWAYDAFFPQQDEDPGQRETLRLHSSVWLEPRQTTVFGGSQYAREGGFMTLDMSDPLDLARSSALPFWFVAGYGIARVLPSPSVQPTLQNPGTDRLRPLFDTNAALISTAFANYFADQPVRTRRFASTLKKALFTQGRSLLPGLETLELRGSGGVTTAADLLDRHRFKQRLGDQLVGIPGVALAHGHQSTIAWIADLVGQILLEAEDDVPPEEMTGLVLVDEIDLYIHPALQVSLVRALKKTFPQIQFVVTTHSPLVLAALRPDEDEIVRLGSDTATGDIVRIDMNEGRPHEPDARVMTTAAILQRYFGLPGIFGGPEGSELAEYQSLAFNPQRTDAQDQRMRALQRALMKDGVELGYPPKPRRAT